MKNLKQSVFIILGIIVMGCVEKEDLCCGIQETNKLSSRWLFYERGYSTGFEYITEAIPSKPAQMVKIGADDISSTVKGWEQLKYYRILTDSASHTEYIALMSIITVLNRVALLPMYRRIPSIWRTIF